MPPRKSHCSWVRSRSRARRIRSARDSTATGMPTTKRPIAPTTVTYFVHAIAWTPIGLVSSGARSVSTGETMRATVVMAATPTTIATTFAQRGDSGLPFGKRWGNSGRVKKYGSAKPHTAYQAVNVPSTPSPPLTAACNPASR